MLDFFIAAYKPQVLPKVYNPRVANPSLRWNKFQRTLKYSGDLYTRQIQLLN